MINLSVKEEDLLHRVSVNAELRPLFFRKVKGLKWFDALEKSGYFAYQNIPRPTPAKQEGYVTIPRWDTGEYLVKTALELGDAKNSTYVPRFLEIISKATSYAKACEFGNYYVWWQFAEIISKIPSQYVSTEFIEDVVDYWLEDKFDRGLVASEVGEKWLKKLLEENTKHTFDLSIKLLEIFYKVIFINKKSLDEKNNLDLEPSLRLKYYDVNKITEKIAFLSGRQLGRSAVNVFHSNLVQILQTLKNDSWSSVWQPAIEEHEQNKLRDEPGNILIKSFRECLCGFLEEHPKDAIEYIAEIIESPFQTIQRLAIFCVTHHYSICGKFSDLIIDSKFFQDNYRYEIWHFLNQNYSLLNPNQKARVTKIIEFKKRYDDGVLLHGATAYEQATWLAAIKDSGLQEYQLYQKAVALAKTEPDHPDFSSYISVNWGGPESPYSVEELNALTTSELVFKLKNFKGSGGWREPGIDGLANSFRELIKMFPSRYYTELTKFAALDLAYIYSILEAYGDLWKGKSRLPWDDIWHYLLEFCSIVIKKEGFWNEVSAHEKKNFIANRYWIVSAIGRLLEAGVKSDEHAFHEKYNTEAEEIIVFILNSEKGEKFEIKSDAVSIAINSPRGQCIEALVNLALRSCRLMDKVNNKDHSEAWVRFQPYFEAEFKRAEAGEYEFITLVANYIPNFLYMSADWVKANLENIFDQTDYMKWKCAMQGYAYVQIIYQEIYSYLSKSGNFLKALNDENIGRKVKEQVIQNIVIANINDFDNLEDEANLIQTLIHRNDFDQLNSLIWSIWTFKKSNDNRLKNKVYDLWPKVMNAVNLSTSEGKKLASALCMWTEFVDYLDAEKKQLILSIAPYADESHNSDHLLESIANLSKEQPFDANEIWLKMLEQTAPDYPEEAIRQILSNLIANGDEGKRLARETVSEYLRQGVETPSIWLTQLLNDS